jgi:hypothetical protein
MIPNPQTGQFAQAYVIRASIMVRLNNPAWVKSGGFRSGIQWL